MEIYKSLKGALLAVFCLSFCASVSAQQREVLRDITGQPFESKVYADVQGSPYFLDEWTGGTVKVQSGNIYSGLYLKYDLVQNQLLFKNEAGQTQVFVEPVAEFELGSLVFRNGYKPADGGTLKTFYQVLADGNTKLLKRTAKRIDEEVSYSTGPKVKSIVETEFYYLATDASNELLRIKKDRRPVLNALKDKKPALEDYIKEQRLDLRNDSHMAKLITYYNSL